MSRMALTAIWRLISPVKTAEPVAPERQAPLVLRAPVDRMACKAFSTVTAEARMAVQVVKAEPVKPAVTPATVVMVATFTFSKLSRSKPTKSDLRAKEACQVIPALAVQEDREAPAAKEEAVAPCAAAATVVQQDRLAPPDPSAKRARPAKQAP